MYRDVNVTARDMANTAVEGTWGWPEVCIAKRTMKNELDRVYESRGLGCPAVKLWVASPLEGLFTACLLARAGLKSLTTGRAVMVLKRALAGTGAGEAWAGARWTLAHLLAEAPAGFDRLGAVLENESAPPDLAEITALLGSGGHEDHGSWWWAFDGVAIACEAKEPAWSYTLSGAVRAPLKAAR